MRALLTVQITFKLLTIQENLFVAAITPHQTAIILEFRLNLKHMAIFAKLKLVILFHNLLFLKFIGN